MKTPDHVQVPHNMCVEGKLNYTDTLVYACIRKYMNYESRQAYPSIDTISRDSGISRPSVIASINRLIKNGDISKGRDGRKNLYKFNNKSKNFEMFSYDLLENTDLTFKQKATIVSCQQYLFKEDGMGLTTWNDKEMSKKIGCSERVYRENKKALEDIGLLTKELDRDTLGNTVVLTKFHLFKIGQAFVCLYNKISDVVDDVDELKRQNISLKIELDDLKKRLDKLELNETEDNPLLVG